MKRDEIISYVFELTMEKEWKVVEDLYSKHSWLHDAKLTKNENTALHVAMLSYNTFQSDRTEHYIDKMIGNMSVEALSTKNNDGETPLHLAAAAGWTKICICIAKKHWELITRRNARNETPLFVAAGHGKDQVFYRLHEIYREAGSGEEAGDSLCRRSDGNTALHVAISGECFDLAKQIIKYYPKLVDDVNVLGESPLHVLAKKPHIFRSVNDLSFWDSLICKYALEDQITGRLEEKTTKPEDFPFPKNYRTCVNIFYFLWIPISSIVQASLGIRRKGQNKQDETRGDVENPQEQEIKKASKRKTRSKQDLDHRYPPNCNTFVMLMKVVMNIILTIVGVGLGKLKKIEGHKERYVKALMIVDKLLKYESSYKYVNDGQRPGQNTLNELPSRVEPPLAPPPDDGSLKSEAGPPNFSDVPPKPEEKPHVLLRADTPIIVAAKLGIHEIVEKIFSKLHIAIVDEDSDGRNVLMLAAQHRHMSVFNHLLDTKHVPEHVFHHVDNHGNNIIHLAAMLEERDKPWRMSGAALQMQSEIKWFEYVKAAVPSTCFTHHINAKGETPEVIFTETHEKLMNQGYSWLIRTSESCSLTATLIAGVAFNTSASVPGGPNSDTGFPILEGHAAFNVFSIASLVALSLAITALVLFLAIITSRSVEQDFKSELTNKLLYGLTCLFASIAAMLVAFCAGHTFVLTDKLKYAEIPIYSLACVPVALYFLAQLPLYVDLLSAVCRKDPVPSALYL